jgi:aspartate dehydrogenase
VGTIEGAQITTRKPPAGLGLDPASLTEPRVIYEGSAREACRRFPQNVNVSAALSLAGIGFDRTRVRIVADPGVSRNVHEIRAWGDFGTIETRTENVPSQNPKTSRLAALSAIALIRGLGSPLRVGT